MEKKRLLLTGGSGFLGRNIRVKLSERYIVDTLGLSLENTYVCDLSEIIPSFTNSFDVVIHAAGKIPSVPTVNSEDDFFKVNLEGTKNLCRALDIMGKPASFVFISSVAVYGVGKGNLLKEDHPLEGKSQYALSKIAAEDFLIGWSESNNIILTILRPSLIAGKDPGGNLAAMIYGLKAGRYYSIGKGSARKSMVMAEDIAEIIPEAAETGGTYNLCDDIHPSFRELELLLSQQLHRKKPVSIPFFLAKLLALAGDIAGSRFPIDSSRLNKINDTLTFSNDKAKTYLNWKPKNVLENFKI
jgi:nucleoside-diphosphate-sugar epimerase